MPMLACRKTSPSCDDEGLGEGRRAGAGRSRARPRRRSMSSHSSVNSSPPKRASVSDGRRAELRRMADVDEQAVAGLVAERVVDDLEAVEVEEEDGDAALAPARAPQRLAEAVEEQRAVGQPGERVVQRAVGELELGALALGDVARDAHHLQRLAAGAAHGARRSSPATRSSRRGAGRGRPRCAGAPRAARRPSCARRSPCRRGGRCPSCVGVRPSIASESQPSMARETGRRVEEGAVERVAREEVGGVLGEHAVLGLACGERHARGDLDGDVLDRADEARRLARALRDRRHVDARPAVDAGLDAHVERGALAQRARAAELGDERARGRRRRRAPATARRRGRRPGMSKISRRRSLA